MTGVYFSPKQVFLDY